MSTQMEYSLINRDIEADVLPAAAALGLGLLPYSPLARGVLSGKFPAGQPIPAEQQWRRPTGDRLQPPMQHQSLGRQLAASTVR